VKGLREVLKNSLRENAIEEIMLVKTVLEEKNDLLEKKDQLIHELYTKIKNLEIELIQLKEKLHEHEKEQEKGKNDAWEQGVESVIFDIINLLSKYERKPIEEKEQNKFVPIEKIVTLLQNRYGLQILEKPQKKINPCIHKLIETNGKEGNISECIVLSRGYRIGKKVIKPMQLKVVIGDKTEKDENIEKSTHGQDIVLIKDSHEEQKTNPEGVA